MAIIKTEGCYLLEELTSDIERIFCLHCQLDTCLLDNSDRPQIIRTKIEKEHSLVMQCGQCGELETVSFIGSLLGTTSRFIQRGDRIIHLTICGECKKVGETF